MGKKPLVPPQSNWPEILRAVRGPLGLFALFGLIFGSALGAVAVRSGSVALGISILLVMLTMVAGVFWLELVKQRHRYPKLGPDSDLEELRSRPEYIQRQVAAISDATSRILLCINKLHRPIDSTEAATINAALQIASQRGVDIRILCADGPDRIVGACNLGDILKNEPRMSRELHFSDLHFLLVDGGWAILGLVQPQTGNEHYQPTRSWVELRSTRLASLLGREFDLLWNNADTIPCGQLRNATIQAALASGADEVEVATQFDMSLEAVRKHKL